MSEHSVTLSFGEFGVKQPNLRGWGRVLKQIDAATLRKLLFAIAEIQKAFEAHGDTLSDVEAEGYWEPENLEVLAAAFGPVAPLVGELADIVAALLECCLRDAATDKTVDPGVADEATLEDLMVFILASVRAGIWDGLVALAKNGLARMVAAQAKEA